MSSKKQEVFSPFDRSSARNSGNDIELSSGPSTGTGQQSGKFSTTHSEKSIDTNTVPTGLIGGESTVFGASFNFVNSIVGAGIIAIPLAIQECGLILGILLLIIVAFLIYRSVIMLIECGMRTEQYDLEQLSEHLLGSRGYYCALIFMFLFAYGAQIAYLIIIGDTVPRAAELLFPGSFLTNRTATLLLSATIIVLPLCLFRSLSTLSWTSLLSILADVIIVIIVLGVCSTITTNQDEHFQERDTGNVENSMFEGVGTMSFAFVCQHNSFIIFRSLKEPTLKNWSYVAGQSVSFACIICIMFGLVGFFTFYPYVEGDLLNNFSVNNPSIATARLLLAITMVFTYPMECYVTRHCIITAMAKLGYSSYLGGESRPGMLSAFWTAVTDRVDAVLAQWCGTDPHAHRHHNHRRPSMDPSSDPTHSRSLSINSTGTVTSNNKNHSKNNMEENKNQRKKTTTMVNSPKGALPVSTLSRSSSGNSAIPNPDSSHSHTSSDDDELTESVTEENGLYATSLSVHVTLTLGIWATTLAIALATTNLGVVAALTGAVAASVLGYILPSVIYMKAHETELFTAYTRMLEILTLLRNGDLADTTSSSSSSSGVVTRENRAASQEELTAECREQALQSAIRLSNSPLQDVEIGKNTTNIYHEDERVPLHPKRRMTTFLLIQEMFHIYSNFYVPFLMVLFGVVALIVGVVTVFTTSA